MENGNESASDSRAAGEPGRNGRASRVLATIERLPSRIWNHKATGWTILAGLLLACLAFWLWPQRAGYAVTILGGVAGVMTLRDMTQIQKVLLTICIFALMGAELRDIRLDAEHQDEQRNTDRKAEDDRFAKLIKEQQGDFEKVLGQDQADFNTTMTTDRKHFDASMIRADALLKKSDAISQTANDNLEAATGGNSYPEITVVTREENGHADRTEVLLAATIWKSKYAGSFTYAVQDDPEQLCNTAAPIILRGDTGKIRPNRPESGIDARLHPDPTKVNHYCISMQSKNGGFLELLTVKFNEEQQIWESTYAILNEWHVVVATRR